VDVEKTMEFILEQQAKAEVSHARFEAAMASMAERQDRTEAVLRRAIRAGVEDARRQRVRTRKLEQTMTELAEAQKKTQSALEAFLESMNRGGNGRH
jgi:hypothetical protein